MKTVFLHGLGQTACDWDETIRRCSNLDPDCPDLFSLAGKEITYPRLLRGLEARYTGGTEPLRLCGLSLGAVLALDYASRHRDQVAALVLIGGQYRTPDLLVDVQNLLFRCMPGRAFADMGLSKEDTIRLTRSMRELDLSEKLPGITCPAAVVCGEKGRANRRAAADMARLLPRAELHIGPGAGHEVNKSAPEILASLLDAQASKLRIEQGAALEGAALCSVILFNHFRRA